MLVKLLHLLPWQQVFYLFLSLPSHWSFVVISAKRSLNILWSGRRQREYKMLWKVGEICEKKEQSRVRQGNLFYRGDLWSCWEKKFWQELVCLSLLGKYLIRAQLFKRQITQSKGWITIHWVSVKKNVMHYPPDRDLSNKWLCQPFKQPGPGFSFLTFSNFQYKQVNIIRVQEIFWKCQEVTEGYNTK